MERVRRRTGNRRDCRCCVAVAALAGRTCVDVQFARRLRVRGCLWGDAKGQVWWRGGRERAGGLAEGKVRFLLLSRALAVLATRHFSSGSLCCLLSPTWLVDSRLSPSLSASCGANSSLLLQVSLAVSLCISHFCLSSPPLLHQRLAVFLPGWLCPLIAAHYLAASPDNLPPCLSPPTFGLEWLPVPVLLRPPCLPHQVERVACAYYQSGCVGRRGACVCAVPVCAVPVFAHRVAGGSEDPSRSRHRGRHTETHGHTNTRTPAQVKRER